MDSDELIERLLKVRAEEFLPHTRRKEAKPGPVVTVSREPGCGGRSIAERLSAELKLHLYSWEMSNR